MGISDGGGADKIGAEGKEEGGDKVSVSSAKVPPQKRANKAIKRINLPNRDIIIVLLMFRPRARPGTATCP